MKVLRTFIKDPNAVLDYGFDWSSWLETGDTLSSSEWIVEEGLDQESYEGLSSTATLCWLSGGTLGLSYLVTNRITTANGRTEDRSFIIKIEQK